MSFNGLIAYLFSVLNNILLSGCTRVFFIHSPTKGCLGCFQVLAIMNKAAINTHVQGIFCVSIDVSFQLLWVNTKECD